mgnify:CR=1 FL=1
MTIEEAIQLAENGDIGAMISLGDYYVQKNNADGVENAYKWYAMAAKHKVVYAIHMALLTKKISAESSLLVATQVEYGVSFAMDEWRELYELASDELDCITKGLPGSEDLKIEDTIANLKEATYHYALCAYSLGDYTKACALIADSDDIRSVILYGSCLIQLADNAKEMANAAMLFAPVIHNQEYVAAQKSALEENAYRTAAIQLSRINKLVGDLETAVSILTFMSNAVRRDNNKQAISEELSHYQKKLFGGYKYV